MEYSSDAISEVIRVPLLNSSNFQTEPMDITDHIHNAGVEHRLSPAEDDYFTRAKVPALIHRIGDLFEVQLIIELFPGRGIAVNTAQVTDPA